MLGIIERILEDHTLVEREVALVTLKSGTYEILDKVETYY